MDFLSIRRPIVVPAGFDEPGISFRIVMMNVDIFLMVLSAVDFDGAAVRAPWAVFGSKVLDGVV